MKICVFTCTNAWLLFLFQLYFLCIYIMFIYCHIDNEKLKIQKKNQKILKKKFWKIEKKENSRKIRIESKTSFHFISPHVIHISCYMVKYFFPDSILESKMGDSLETRISTVEHIQEEFGHDIQEMKGQLARLTKLIKGRTGIMPGNIHGSPSFPL